MPQASYRHLAQSAIREWISDTQWVNPFAVTLNLKQVIQIEADHGRVFIHLDDQKASRNLRYFINKVSRHYLGNTTRRFGSRLPVIPVLEGGKGKRLHFHLMIDLPPSATIEEVYPLFVTTWMGTQWGYGQVNIQQRPDGGWLNYITKLRDKADAGEAIDWTNLYHPSLSAH